MMQAIANPAMGRDVLALSCSMLFFCITFLVLAINIVRYKVTYKKTDLVYALIFILCVFISSSAINRTGFIAQYVPWLKKFDFISEAQYYRFSLTMTALAQIAAIKLLLGQKYPRIWMLFAAIGIILGAVIYVSF